MRQLVQLQKKADEFRDLNAELIFVFREESEGVSGLQKIKDRSKTEFKLAVDLGKKNSAAYSPKRMTFDNFVIDKNGVVRGIIDGTLRDRAKAEQLMKFLRDANADAQ